jgi:integrase
MSNKYKIVDWFWIDEDQRIKAILTDQSPCWYARYNLADVGQRKQSLKTKSKKQARIYGAKLANQLATGGISGNRKTRTTVADAAAQMCDRMRQRRKREDSVHAYERVFRKLAAWMKQRGLAFLDQLTVAGLEAFERELRETGVATPPRPGSDAPGKRGKPDGRRAGRKAKPLMPKPVRDHMKAVRGLIRFALNRDLVARDPAASYDLPPGESAEVETFTPEELARIFADPDADMAEVWRFLVHTCLRAGEFCWLLKTDVVLDKGHPVALHIRRKTCPQTGVVWDPKHKMQRLVPLSPEAAGIVARRLALGGGPWLFAVADTVGPQVGKWKYGRLRDLLAARVAAAGVAHGSLHVFRHTGASYLANHPTDPMPLPQLQSFLGHRRITATQVYLHARPAEIWNALQRMDFTRLGGSVAAAASMPAPSPTPPGTAAPTPSTPVPAKNVGANQKGGHDEPRDHLPAA